MVDIVEVKSWTTWIIIFGAIIVAFIILITQLNLNITLEKFLILLVFVLVVVIAIIFLLGKGRKNKERDIFEAGEEIIKQWKKRFDEQLYWKEAPEKASTKTYEANNKTYFAYNFETTEHPNIIVVWDRKDDMVADWDVSPAAQRLKHPFLGFDPVEGKYKPQFPRELEGKLPVKFTVKDRDTDNFGDEFEKRD